MYDQELFDWIDFELIKKGREILKTDLIFVGSSEEIDDFGGAHTIIHGGFSSPNGVYNTILDFDQDDGELMDYECQCQRFKRETFCEHCTALYFYYFEEEDLEEKRQDPMSSAFHDLNQNRTDYQITSLLTRYGALGMAEYTQMEKQGSVRIEPHLDFSGNVCSLEFKIGISQMYVLKDILKLVQASQKGELIKYGKKLELIPFPNAFEPDSRKLLEFLGKTFQRPRYQLSDYRQSQEMNRHLVLDVDSIDRFVELIEGQTIYGRVEGCDKESWCVAKGIPSLEFFLEGVENGAVFKGRQIKFFMGRDYGYFFADGTIYKKLQDELSELRYFLEYWSSGRNRPVFIAESDLGAFCSELLPVIEQCFPVKPVNLSLDAYFAAEGKLEIYLDMPERGMVVCQLTASYGDETYQVFATDYMALATLGNRNKKQEMEAKEVVNHYFNAFDPKKKRMVLSDDEELLYQLLTKGIPTFTKISTVYISDRMKEVKVIPSPRIQVGVALKGNLLELQLESELPLDQLAALLSKYDRKKRYYRLKDGSFVDLGEEAGLDVIAQLRDGLSLTPKQIKSGIMKIPRYRALYLDAQLKESHAMGVKKDKGFKALIRNMKTVEDSDFEIPTELEDILREYQKQGFLWLKTLCANGFSGILADDMGLGKTLQVIAFLWSEQSTKNSLIICPASLVYNWNREFARFAPGLKTVMVVGGVAERKELIEKAEPGEILITSYDLLKRDLESYGTKTFFCQVLDEAQYIKNHGTQASQAAKSIVSQFRLALTGTPIENSLGELWSIFDYAMPGFLYQYQQFKNDIEQPIVKHQSEAAMDRLRKMITPFILRRLKKDVLSDLPDKLEKNTFAMLKGQQEQLYKAHVQRLKILLEGQSEDEFHKSQMLILSELTKLRQLCCDPSLLFEDYDGESSKLELCLELISNAVEGGHKVLLFSQFTSMLSQIERRLEKEKIPYYGLTGDTSKEKRARLVEQFQSDQVPVFCISLKAGGTGLNLTAADIVIHYDPWWNGAVETQASDRAHRIGQKNVVTVYKLIAKDTIEEKIVALQEQKKELADQVLSGGQVGGGSFSKEELLALLGGR